MNLTPQESFMAIFIGLVFIWKSAVNLSRLFPRQSKPYRVTPCVNAEGKLVNL